jgi:hypothetical protein
VSEPQLASTVRLWAEATDELIAALDIEMAAATGTRFGATHRVRQILIDTRHSLREAVRQYAATAH